jgi:hypothetical protein
MGINLVGRARRSKPGALMKKAAVPSIVVVVVLLALGAIAEAQQPKKVPRIGYLSSLNPVSESTRAEGIRLAAMWMSSH